ncbi:MAG: LemA family protein [Enterobacterales bacterium]|nr:LemA family protein [Enterobacterales bacterium]
MEFWIFIIVVGGIIFYLVGVYNQLVTLKNRFKNAFSQIDVQLTRRYDLIPNLVNTAKGYMKHEKETLQAVIQARNVAVNANKAAAGNPGNPVTMEELAAAETALTGSLGKLFALSESYPDLKANETMLSLMEELTSTENKVSFSRQSFNDSVMQYNTYREQFPNSFIADRYHFDPAELLKLAEPAARQAIKVSFD